MINKLSPLNYTQLKPNSTRQFLSFDSYGFENPCINKSVLVQKGIIKPQDNINDFFDNIAKSLMPDNKDFATLLKNGVFSLSSSCYSDLNNAKSAVALELDSKKLTSQHLAYLEDYIAQGCGIGLNFKEFKNPCYEIKKINEYFKFRQNSLKRPPAAIALLPVRHFDILNFISLKDGANYDDWCFDLSVIIDDDFITALNNRENITLYDGKQKPAIEIYTALINSMAKYGEPGIIFSNDDNFICDCCACAKLNANQGLYLSHINLSKFYDEKTKSVNYNYLKYASNLLSCAMKKINPDNYIGIVGYQELLDKLGLKYGSKDALDVLENCLKTIKTTNNKLALSPTSTISRLLNVTPSVEPSNKADLTYYDELDTMACAQKYLDGAISKTIILKGSNNLDDTDKIVRYCTTKGIKGISVFPS